MRRRLNKIAVSTDEEGMSIVELLGAITILGIVLPLFVGYIILNSKMIAANTIQTEAIAIREDIREWMSYRAQSQDIYELNPYVMTTTGNRPGPVYPTEEGIEKVRAKHLILDKSGIMKDDQGNPMFGEQIPSDIVVVGKQRSSESRNRRQVLDYDYEKKGVSLKASVLSDIKPYVGQYVGLGYDKLAINYAVLVEADPKEFEKNANTSDNSVSGILVTLRVYNGITGAELTNTQFHWNADY